MAKWSEQCLEARSAIVCTPDQVMRTDGSKWSIFRVQKFTPVRQQTQNPKESTMSPEKILYTATATVTGGRDGRAISSDQVLDVRLATPRELGGAGGVGTNPEQLFAAGYFGLLPERAQVRGRQNRSSRCPRMRASPARWASGPFRPASRCRCSLRFPSPACQREQVAAAGERRPPGLARIPMPRAAIVDVKLVVAG